MGLFTFSPGHCGPGGVKLARGVANTINPETGAQLSILILSVFVFCNLGRKWKYSNIFNQDLSLSDH